MNDTNTNTLDQLKQVSSGLLFMSESDYPFEAFLWEAKDAEALSHEKLLQLTSHPPNTPVEVVELDYFFRRATTAEHWYGAEDRETVKKYQALVETLKSHLTSIKVYRLGTITIDVYIVGKTKSGDWAGLSTKVIET